MMKIAALISMAALAVADQTFSLTAEGGYINSGVSQTDDNRLAVNAGPAGVFTLDEPSGYLHVGDQYLQAAADGFHFTSKSEASRDFGVINGNQLRFNTNGPTFYGCPIEGDVIIISNVVCQDGNGQEISLYTAPADGSNAALAGGSSSAGEEDGEGSSTDSNGGAGGAAATNSEEDSEGTSGSDEGTSDGAGAAAVVLLPLTLKKMVLPLVLLVKIPLLVELVLVLPKPVILTLLKLELLNLVTLTLPKPVVLELLNLVMLLVLVMLLKPVTLMLLKLVTLMLLKLVTLMPQKPVTPTLLKLVMLVPVLLKLKKILVLLKPVVLVLVPPNLVLVLVLVLVLLNLVPGPALTALKPTVVKEVKTLPLTGLPNCLLVSLD